MPAKKPAALHRRHATKAQRSARAAAESSTAPRTQLPLKPPAALTRHKTASATWKRIVGLYSEISGVLVTAFDANLLIKYCLVDEECAELVTLRKDVYKEWRLQVKILEKIDPDPVFLKIYFAALAQANALLGRYQGLDARLDGKRKLLVAMEQSLYLTPRSRAGVAPTEKEPEAPSDDMGKLLSEE